VSETTSSSGASGGADFDLTQFYQVFFEEAGENLANMETLLLDLDVAAPDDEDLNAIFRCAHSIKGGAATFGFQDVADLTHVMETLLDRLRRHELALHAGMVDVLLESGDTLRGLLGRHKGISDVVIDASDLAGRIRVHADGTVRGPVVAAAPACDPAAAGAVLAGRPTTDSAAAQPAAEAAGGARTLTITIGPLDQPGLADSLAELFDEIPGLGSIERLDDGKPDAAGLRRFKVSTASSDDELLDLFTFHVARDRVAIAPWVAAVQAAYQFQDYVPMRYLGTVIGKSVVIELGPVLTALVVGGRVGASIAAELGTMKVTEQIDALETMAIDPIRYLVAPRLIAGLIMLPVVTIFADFVAILGSWVVALVGLDVNTHTFFAGLKLFFHVSDVTSGLVKALFFGGIIALMGCFHGMRTEGGAEGVGIATTKAVVSSCLLILITDYVLASMLFRGIFMG